MKAERPLILALTVLTGYAEHTAQPSPTPVVAQAAAGRSTGDHMVLTLGLPAPRQRPHTAFNPSLVRSADEVPLSLGRTIRWTTYTLEGRKVGEGLHEFSEAGARKLILTSEEAGGRGPRVILCQGLTGRSRWRRLVWITRE